MSDNITAEEAKTIALGEEAKEFLNGNLGKYLLEMAAFHEEDAKNRLVECSSTNVKEIERLQSIVLRHRDIEQWIYDLIQLGDQTYIQYLENQE